MIAFWLLVLFASPTSYAQTRAFPCDDSAYFRHIQISAISATEVARVVLGNLFRRPFVPKAYRPLEMESHPRIQAHIRFKEDQNHLGDIVAGDLGEGHRRLSVLDGQVTVLEFSRESEIFTIAFCARPFVTVKSESEKPPGEITFLVRASPQALPYRIEFDWPSYAEMRKSEAPVRQFALLDWAGKTVATITPAFDSGQNTGAPKIQTLQLEVLDQDFDTRIGFAVLAAVYENSLRL